MRPRRLEEFVGQRHLVGPEGLLTRYLEEGYLPSCVLWGPPGVGKTTLARLLAEKVGRPFYALSAVSAGVAEVRQVLAQAESTLFSPVLFLDEIHRFNRAQQDALLGAVEQGKITLIGATTENPSFEVAAPLLSRMQVFVLEPLQPEELLTLLERALREDRVLRQKTLELVEVEALLAYSGGDARKLLSGLEAVVASARSEPIRITNDLVREALRLHIRYDRAGEQHYDAISAFIKSVRGSDPDAALYWLAVMLEGGEDPLFIARRLVILAAEDVGLADPAALPLAVAAFQAVQQIGLPEGRIPLGEATLYLALAPKSVSAYQALERALEEVRQHGAAPVPLHLRNAVTPLMRKLGYGQGYLYPPDFPDERPSQPYLPDTVKGPFYRPGKLGWEAHLPRKENL